MIKKVTQKRKGIHLKERCGTSSTTAQHHRESLAGLDNVASEGSDAFDELISISKSMKNEELKSLMEDLMAG